MMVLQLTINKRYDSGEDWIEPAQTEWDRRQPTFPTSRKRLHSGAGGGVHIKRFNTT